MLQLRDETMRPRCAAFSPSGDRVVAGGCTGEVRIRRLATGAERVARSAGSATGYRSVAFNPNGQQFVAAGTWQPGLRDAETGKLIHTFKTGYRDMEWVRTVTFTPDGSQVIFGSEGDGVSFWDVITGRQTNKLRKGSGPVVAIVSIPDGTWIVHSHFTNVYLGSLATNVNVWDVENGAELLRLPGHDNYVDTVAISPDGKRIVTGSRDTTLKILSTKTGHFMKKLTGHQGSIHCVTFSPEGKRILSGSADKTMRLWDVETGRLEQTYDFGLGTVWSVSVSAEGFQIVVAASKGVILVDYPDN